MYKDIKKQAFTLAEVLITLGIIGIVAAMTLPNLIANYQKKIYVNQLRKTVSIVEQGFHKRMADLEVTDLSYGGIVEMLDPEVFKTEMPKTFKVVKTCVTDISCMPKDRTTNTVVKYKPLKPGGVPPSLENYYLAVLNDGTFIGFKEHFCGPVRNMDLTNLKYNCGFVFIDVNGAKGPNQYGRDAFSFVIGNTGNLFPLHGDVWSEANFGDTSKTYKTMPEYCDTSYASSSGDGCAARIIDDKWEMKY